MKFDKETPVSKQSFLGHNESDEVWAAVIKELGLCVRLDCLREKDPWTVYIPGLGRGDGETPAKAAKAFFTGLVMYRAYYEKAQILGINLSD